MDDVTVVAEVLVPTMAEHCCVCSGRCLRTSAVARPSTTTYRRFSRSPYRAPTSGQCVEGAESLRVLQSVPHSHAAGPEPNSYTTAKTTQLGALVIDDMPGGLAVKHSPEKERFLHDVFSSREQDTMQQLTTSAMSYHLRD